MGRVVQSGASSQSANTLANPASEIYLQMSLKYLGFEIPKKHEKYHQLIESPAMSQFLIEKIQNEAKTASVRNKVYADRQYLVDHKKNLIPSEKIESIRGNLHDLFDYYLLLDAYIKNPNKTFGFSVGVEAQLKILNDVIGSLLDVCKKLIFVIQNQFTKTNQFGFFSLYFSIYFILDYLSNCIRNTLELYSQKKKRWYKVLMLISHVFMIMDHVQWEAQKEIRE